MAKRDVMKGGEKKGEEHYDEPAIETHRKDVYLDEFFDLFTESKDNELHNSGNPKIKRAIRSLKYSRDRAFNVSTDRRVAALLSTAVMDGIITAGTRTAIRKGIPL